MIDTYKSAAAENWIQGQAIWGVGQRDVKVAIDTYLEAKRKILA